jgi:hypothetical protein
VHIGHSSLCSARRPNRIAWSCSYSGLGWVELWYTWAETIGNQDETTMADSYTTLWSSERCRRIKQARQEGAKLSLLFGGPHTSEPSFSRAGVKAGDYIYPIHVQNGILSIIGRMRIREILPLEAYLTTYAHLFADCTRKNGVAWAEDLLDQYFTRHPEQRYLRHTCTEEVILGEDGTPIRFDIALPPALLIDIRFRSQRRERGIKYIENGKLKNVLSLQGIYRLAEQSAQDFERLLLEL